MNVKRMFLMSHRQGAKKKKKRFLLRVKLENSRWRTASIVCKPKRCCSVVKLCLTLWPRGLQHTRLPCFSPSPGACSNSCPLSWRCHPTISFPVAQVSSCFQSFPASGSSPVSRLFSSGGQKYWSFSFSISPSNEYSRLISCRMDWLDLLAVQGTLKSLLQHHSSKVSILWCSAFFMVQLSPKSSL